MAKKVVTDVVRLSYVTLFEPRAVGDSDAKKYSVSILIPKDDTATVEAIEAAIAEELKSPKLKGKTKGLKLPLKDGDEERDEPEYQGHYFVNCNRATPPLLLNRDKTTLDPMDPQDRRVLYSGCYAKVSINFSAYAVPQNKGVGAYLNAVMFWEDGEALGGTYTEAEAAADFGDDDPLM